VKDENATFNIDDDCNYFLILLLLKLDLDQLKLRLKAPVSTERCATKYSNSEKDDPDKRVKSIDLSICMYICFQQGAS
jgi:hypothetical protein